MRANIQLPLFQGHNESLVFYCFSKYIVLSVKETSYLYIKHVKTLTEIIKSKGDE